MLLSRPVLLINRQKRLILAKKGEEMKDNVFPDSPKSVIAVERKNETPRQKTNEELAFEKLAATHGNNTARGILRYMSPEMILRMS